MTLPEQAYLHLAQALAAADAEHAANYPGDDGRRQPVHTVYVPADRFTAALPAGWGRAARDAVDAHLPGARGGDGVVLADLLGTSTELAGEVLARVRRKLAVEPIEDVRVDFEDGFGPRSDAEEDAAARAAGRALAELAGEGGPPFCGIRMKSLEPATRVRGVRTVDLVLAGMLATGPLPDGFVITLPKVTFLEQVRAFVQVCAALEVAHGLPPGRLRFEIQVETPQAILGADGSAAIARMLHAGAGRVSGLHYGTYDYSAACGIAAPYQSMEHPVADHARAVMQLAAAGTGVRLSDGSTNVLPVGNPAQILAAWRLHAGLVRRSLQRGYYQGWDLHPAQLVTRYAATYAFYREGMPQACDRLRAYLQHSSSGVLDEPATAQAMASLLVRGMHCGALDGGEVSRRSGASLAELDTLSRRRVG